GLKNLLKMSGGRVAHRFDVVAVGVENEGPVIVGVINLAYARRAIVPATGPKRGGVKRIDIGARFRGESEMQMAGASSAAADPEIGLVAAIAGDHALRNGKFHQPL